MAHFVANRCRPPIGPDGVAQTDGAVDSRVPEECCKALLFGMGAGLFIGPASLSLAVPSLAALGPDGGNEGVAREGGGWNDRLLFLFSK